MRVGFLRNKDGIAAVEFAALLPLFVWMSLMIAQIGLYFYDSAALQRGTDAAIRQILVGSVANSNLTQAQFISQTLCPQLSNFTCSNIVVNLEVAPSDFYSLTNKTANTNLPLGYSLSALNSVPMNNNQTSYCIVGNGSVIIVQVFYAMPVIGIPAFASSTVYNGTPVVWIQADDVFKNEPFTTSYTGC